MDSWARPPQILVPRGLFIPGHCMRALLNGLSASVTVISDPEPARPNNELAFFWRGFCLSCTWIILVFLCCLPLFDWPQPGLLTSLPTHCQSLLVPVLDPAHDLVSFCSTVTEISFWPSYVLYWALPCASAYLTPVLSSPQVPKFKSSVPASWHLCHSLALAISGKGGGGV